MKLRNKKTKSIENVKLVDDSAFVMDLEDNKLFKHSIRKNSNIIDPRISITFRNVGTFYDPKLNQITGTGADAIMRIEVKNGGLVWHHTGLNKEELLNAWSREHNEYDYTYADLYGRGSNVLLT
jgi:hypothetical protein